MAHKYMPKIFHGPQKNPPPSPPSHILNVRSLKKKQETITHGLIADLRTQNAMLNFNDLLPSEGTIYLINFYFLQQKP